MGQWCIAALAGFGAGILSAWGIGGGTLLLLVMTLLLGVEQTQAQGVNLVYFLPTAAMSVWEHHRAGYLDRTLLRTAIPIGVLTSLLTAWATMRVDTALLRRPFGLFLLWAAARMLWKR